MSVLAGVLVSTVLGLLEPPATPTPASAGPPLAETTESVRAREEKPPRPDDKTLVASLDIEQGDGKDRLSLYRDGTLALVKTYLGVRTLKKKVISDEEVAFIARVCSEPLALDVGTYRADVLGQGEPRRFRIEVGLPGSLPRVFAFDIVTSRFEKRRVQRIGTIDRLSVPPATTTSARPAAIFSAASPMA